MCWNPTLENVFLTFPHRLSFLFRSSDEFGKFLDNGVGIMESLVEGKSMLKSAMLTIASSRGPSKKKSLSQQVQSVLEAFPTQRGERYPYALAFEETLLGHFAKMRIQHETFRSADEEETRIRDVLKALKDDYDKGLLPVALQLRLVLACMGISSTSAKLTPSMIFQMVEDERVGQKVSSKLRQLLSEQEAVRRSLKYYIVKVVAVKNVHQANARLKVIIRNDHSTSKALPPELQLTLPECYQLPQGLLPRVPGLLFFGTSSGGKDLAKSHFGLIDGLVERVVLERDPKSGKVRLGMVESEQFVRALRALLESYDLPVFISASRRNVHLMIDPQTLEEAGRGALLKGNWTAKGVVLDMLRREQNGSLVRGLGMVEMLEI